MLKSSSGAKGLAQPGLFERPAKEMVLQVFILGRMGNAREALQLIIDQLGDIPQVLPGPALSTCLSHLDRIASIACTIMVQTSIVTRA